MTGKTRNGAADRAGGQPRAGTPAVSRPVTREIDENLRRVYQATLEEEVPDRFRDLLERLRAGEGRDGGAS